MRRIILVSAALFSMLLAAAGSDSPAHGQLFLGPGDLYSPIGPYFADPWGYPGFGFGYYDPLDFDWRLGRMHTGLSGLNFGGGFGAPAWVGRPVIYANRRVLTSPVRVGIDFVPLEFAAPDLNTGAPPLTDPVVVTSSSPADSSPYAELEALAATLSPRDREVLARHLRKTSGKETAADIAESASRVRRTSVAAKMRSSKILDVGDALFHEQKYHEALQRYKSATAAAPDMIESWLRQGFALSATGRYELATRAFRRAAAIDPSALDAKFSLDDLYRDAVEAKASHYDALARAALAEPERADLLYLLGMMLHFDGERDRAAAFFSAAKSLEAPAAPSEAGADDGAPADGDEAVIGVET
jgi:tetratricopeptide (TPR) repeat protein